MMIIKHNLSYLWQSKQRNIRPCYYLRNLQFSVRSEHGRWQTGDKSVCKISDYHWFIPLKEMRRKRATASCT